jgi:signal transduction histidine kinase
MILSAYSIPIWISVILIASLAVVTYFGSKKTSARIFSFAIFIVAIYTTSSAYFLFQDNFTIEDFGVRLTFFLGIIVASFIYLFAKSLGEERLPNIWSFSLMVIVAGVLFYGFFYTNYLVGQPISIKNLATGVLWGWSYGPYSFIYYAVLLIYYALSIRILYNAIKASKDRAVRSSLEFTIVGLIVGVVSGIVFNTVLPQMGNFDYLWLGLSFGIVWVSLIAYSIVRYHEMSIRLVLTEVLVIAMIIAAFVNIFIGDFLGTGGKVFIFIAFALLGVFLIRTSSRESGQREQLADLNETLQVKVEQQTKEIRASYEFERAARLELEKVDEAKNQFILITQHHLRTPITSLKWQLEALIAGTYGPVAGEAKKAMTDMGEAVERLNHLINSLLSISALKAGIETIKKTSISMSKIVSDILGELKKDIDRKKISVTMDDAPNLWPILQMDEERMREAIFIVIENAVRYNIDAGKILITSRPTEKTYELIVENSGASLSEDDKKKIFSELFYRSNMAQVSNPTGMGIGLSMAQAIIEAHKGTISLNSRKEGGVKVVVTLPYL